MFGIDWDGDGSETIFDDILTAHIVFGEDEEKNNNLFDESDDEDDY